MWLFPFCLENLGSEPPANQRSEGIRVLDGPLSKPVLIQPVGCDVVLLTTLQVFFLTQVLCKSRIYSVVYWLRRSELLSLFLKRIHSSWLALDYIAQQ